MVEHHPQCSADIRKALKQTVLLEDGQYGYVFTEQGYDGPDPKWSCHVCCRTIVTERAFSMHLNHPLHNSKLLIPQHPRSQFKKFADNRGGEDASPPYIENESSGEDKSEKSPSMDVVPDVVPGEPVPPGMEDMVEGVCQIQAAFDSYTAGPLLGLEYIVELISTEEEGEPRYICLLCEKKGDPRSVMVHVTSQNHYLKYISCFFRTAGNALNMITRTNDTRRGISIAITKVATEIERHYGRLKPTSAEAETFMARKYEILRQIDEKQHFRETPTTTFAELVTIEKIREYNNLPEDALWFDHYATPKKDYQEEREKLVSLEKTKEIDERKINPRPVVSDSVDPGYIVDLRKDEDVIIIPDDKTSSAMDVRSLSSVSSISSSSGSKFRQRRRGSSRSRSRHRYPKGRSRSRSGSRHRRRYRTRPRSHSRGRTSGYSRVHRRSRSRERYRGRRSPHSQRRASPVLPYSRHPRSRSRSRERHFRDLSPSRHYKSRRPETKYRPRDNMESSRDRYSPKRRSDSGRPENENVKKLKWEKFQRELEKLEDEMEEQLKYFKTRPEKHPKYPEEWKSFWNRRYKELQHAGKDPSVYDFKPEWIVFWDKRMKELHEEELARKKEELRHNVELEEWGRNSSLSNDLQDISPPTPDANKEITVNDIKNTWKALTGSDITAPHSTRSPSPWECNSSSSLVKEYSPAPQVVRARREGASTLNDIVPPIVHCLRMLSVLENQLGSLGPKIIELLSKALALEKTKPSASMTLLQNRDIFLLFETVKEKFRAQLLAGVVMRHLVAPTRAVIKSIDNMLTSNPLNPEVFEPVKVAGVGMVDKVAVAQQIASALVSQGRTDVSQQELEELINAVVGMAQASNANPVPNMSSAAFFSQLNIQNSTGSSHINQILSNMIAKAQQSISNDPASQSYQSVQFPSNDPVPNSYQPSQFQPSPFQTSQFPTNDRPPSQSLYASQFPTTDRPPQSYQSDERVTNSLFSSGQFQSNVPNEQTLGYKDMIPHTVGESFLEAKATVVNSVQSDSNLCLKQETPQEDPDARLKSRLMRFQELPREEQHKIIDLLKEMERTQPQRVERLRSCVSMSLVQGTGLKNDAKRLSTNRLSPFSSRSITVNPEPEKNKNPSALRNKNVDTGGKSYETVRIEDDDDDDDDYSYEDVYNAASEKLRIKQLEEEGGGQALESAVKKSEVIVKENPEQDIGNQQQQYVSPEPPQILQQSNPVQGNYLNAHSNYNSQYSQGALQQQYNTAQYYPQQNTSSAEQLISNNPAATGLFRTEKGFNPRSQNYNSRSDQNYNQRQYNQPGYNAYPNNYNQY